MNVFSDLHHSGLFYSLKLLFEDRLGYKLYRPIGVEWFDNGYWDIAKPYGNNPDTVSQYLLLDSRYTPKDNTVPLNRDFVETPTHYEIRDEAHDFTEKALTFQQFLDTDIDIIIASIPDHWLTYTRLRDKYKPQAKVICQMGNMFNEVSLMMKMGIVKNLMASTSKFDTPSSVEAIFYHQEQPLTDFVEPPRTKSIKSFVNLLPEKELFYQFKQTFLEKGYDLKSYGASCPDGYVDKLRNLYKSIQESDFIFHNKPRGDGYGWVFHSSFLNGRIVITNFEDYKDKLGGALLEDKKTAINIAHRSVSEVVDIIDGIYQDKDLHLKLSREAFNRFHEVVDYQKEQEAISHFLNNLKR